MTPDLNAFEGHWTISRQIEDRRAGAGGQLVGTARFTAVTSGLRYDEEGQLNLPGAAPMTARRRYFWQQGRAGIDVSFDDMRPFHSIGGQGRATHWCDPDSYIVRYDFSAWPDAWSAEWQVSGPRKNYTMRTLYQRAGSL